MSSCLHAKVAASLLAASSLGSAMAGPALSWNLSRDMYLDATTAANPGANPVGDWTIMATQTPHVPASYFPLPVFQAPCVPSLAQGTQWCWRDAQSDYTPVVSVNDVTQPSGTANVLAGLPHVHPGPTTPVLVRWTAPVAGNIRVLGRFSDIDPGCGNGVHWSIDLNGATLQSGNVQDSAAGDFGKAFNQTAYVQANDSLYFIVESRNNNYYCDTTDLDVLITMQQ